MAYRIYFAGDLFDHKHLTGNRALAHTIEELSANHYRCALPQDWEATLTSATEIRNNDIKNVIHSDFILCNFDGVDLDSGTVVEFMIAKMLDIPAVLLRTDIRNGGYLFGDDWNLMVVGYPRCALVKHPALMLYNDVGLEKMHETIATSIISALQSVGQEKSVLTTYDDMIATYRHVVTMCGSGLSNLIPEAAIRELVAAKIEKKIYTLREKEFCNAHLSMEKLS